MTKFYIEVPEIHNSIMVIEANNVNDAKQLVADGEGTELDLVYVSTDQDLSNWVVEVE